MSVATLYFQITYNHYNLIAFFFLKENSIVILVGISRFSSILDMILFKFAIE